MCLMIAKHFHQDFTTKYLDIMNDDFIIWKGLVRYFMNNQLLRKLVIYL